MVVLDVSLSRTTTAEEIRGGLAPKNLHPPPYDFEPGGVVKWMSHPAARSWHPT